MTSNVFSSFIVLESKYTQKTIEDYLGSVPSLTFNTIKTKLMVHAFQSSRYLQSKWMLYFSHALMV